MKIDELIKILQEHGSKYRFDKNVIIEHNIPEYIAYDNLDISNIYTGKNKNIIFEVE